LRSPLRPIEFHLTIAIFLATSAPNNGTEATS
jgi:hypothetical protein